MLVNAAREEVKILLPGPEMVVLVTPTNPQLLYRTTPRNPQLFLYTLYKVPLRHVVLNSPNADSPVPSVFLNQAASHLIALESVAITLFHLFLIVFC